MVQLDERLSKIKRLFVDRGKYFVINRGRQYGKTTTLKALAEYLKDDHLVISMDFQMLSTASFENEAVFSHAFAEMLTEKLEQMKAENKQDMIALLACFNTGEKRILRDLFVRLSKLCEKAEKPIVLMIDEMDSASNNQVFLDFLALLRGYYLERENRATFQSVILAGVYDVKNLKWKIRLDEEHKYKSPWNIVAKFNLDMSFSADQTADMFHEYEEDNKTGMDIYVVAKCIEYPYLVSAICKLLDEEILGSRGFENMASVWTEEGIAEAVKVLLKENTSLFDSMVKQLNTFKDLRNMMEEILYQGRIIPYSPYVESVNLGVMFGFLKEEDGHIAVANRIFEMGLLNMFMTEESVSSEAYRYGQKDRNQFIKDAKLDMVLVLRKFTECFTDLYGDNDEKFVEVYGRKFFLLFLKPIINGVGNYYIEAMPKGWM